MNKRILFTLLCLVCCWSATWAQQRTLTGRVTDQSNGQALPGVSVTIRGTQRGTVTSAEGAYSLSADPASTLVFSFIGYTPAEVPVGTRETVNFALEPSSRNLDEVVVVGYGTQKRATLTGAVTQLRREDLVVRQVATASNLLQGLAPGVTVTQQSGRPGADGARVTIRGAGSLFSGTTPLLVIDGVQQPSNTLETLDNIDPNNIESVTVLKDAASTAIYGARAANGVIVVRTRRGATDGVQIDYNGFVSGQEATRLPERISGLEHLLLNNQAAINSSATAPFNATFVEAYRTNAADNFRYFDTDWLGGLLTNSGLMQNHNLNISGGSERVRFFLAGTYLNQQGLTQNTSFKRYDLRFNTDVKLTKNLSFQGDLIYTNSTEIQPGGSTAEFIIRQALGIPASGNPDSAGGKFGPGQYGAASQSNFRNPIAQAEASGFNRVQRPNTILRANFTYRPFTFMDVEAQFSNNSRQSIQKRYIRNYGVYRPNLTTNELTFVNNYPGQNSIADAIGRSQLNNYLIQTNFYKTLVRSELKLLLGFQAEDFVTESLGASRTSLPSDQPYQTVGTANQSNSSGTAEYALAAAFGRLNYTFDDKYLLEVNGRYDGSSRFSQLLNRQWGFFPSVSAGWVISKEVFMNGMANAVTFAKLRGSYGKLGNQNLINTDGSANYYPFAANFALGQNYYFNNQLNFGVGQTNAVNPDITWETSTQANIGLDLTLFKNLSVTVDVFQRTISNLLLARPIPNFTGFNPAFINAGSMRNRGFELSLTYRNQLSNGLRYSATGLLSDAKNEVIDLGGQDLIEGRAISTPGSPLRSYYGYLADGLYQTKEQVTADNALDGNAATPYIAANTTAGDIRYKDISGAAGVPDGKIDGFDRTILGNPFPRYSYSLTTNLAWKGFDLNVFLQGVGQRDSYVSGTGAWAFYSADFISTAFAIHRDAWTPDNPNATYPRLTTDQNTFNWRDSNYWVRNAAYLRLKNVQLGYTIPASFSQKLRIRSARIYVSGQNLATFTSFLSGFDPEKDDQTGEFYPVMRTTTVGLNLKF